jgi:hypothetical protein
MAQLDSDVKKSVQAAVAVLEKFADKCQGKTIAECTSLLYTGLAIVSKYSCIEGPQGPTGQMGPPAKVWPAGTEVCPACHAVVHHLERHISSMQDATHTIFAVHMS